MKNTANTSETSTSPTGETNLTENMTPERAQEILEAYFYFFSAEAHKECPLGELSELRTDCLQCRNKRPKLYTGIEQLKLLIS